ncbi:phosphatase PAP2 family protein [Thermaurantimonas sp.]|uniref:phosphatase PAP2 family protein n=1 Tax=Thermaurantimonas sp. TaxID=2681568 RepID=UPI00391B0E62
MSLFFDKVELHLALNSWKHPLSDVFFKFITHLGDGLIFLPFILYFGLKKNREYFLLYSTAAVITLIVTALGKSVLFPNIDRPILEIGADKLKLVEGVRMHKKYSFPSGHTMAAFAFWSLVAVIAPKKLGYLFALIAILVGISRVYLSQHFIPDVAAGGLLGILISHFCVRLVNIFNPKE